MLRLELALQEWRDVGGSKLAPPAMLRAALDLAFIRRDARRDVGRSVPPPAFAWQSKCILSSGLLFQEKGIGGQGCQAPGL